MKPTHTIRCRNSVSALLVVRIAFKSLPPDEKEPMLLLLLSLLCYFLPRLIFWNMMVLINKIAVDIKSFYKTRANFISSFPKTDIMPILYIFWYKIRKHRRKFCCGKCGKIFIVVVLRIIYSYIKRPYNLILNINYIKLGIQKCIM